MYSIFLCRYAHVLTTFSDGLGKAVCEKYLHKGGESALPSQIVMICASKAAFL